MKTPMKFTLVVVILVTMTVGLDSSVTTNLFRKYPGTRSDGTVILNKEGLTRIECGSMCHYPECVGFDLHSDGVLTCTAFSAVTSSTADAKTDYYCADCRLKGQECVDDTQCNNTVPNTFCDTTSGNPVCACAPMYVDDGPNCALAPVQLGDPCELDGQCLSATNDTRCADVNANNIPVCTCEIYFNLHSSGTWCVFDHLAAGFEPYNGRLVYHRAIVRDLNSWISWEEGKTFCEKYNSTMFIPRDGAEATWFDSKVSSGLDLFAHFPVNDLADEGSLVWNNGQSAAGDSLIPWNLNIEGIGNNDLLDCVRYVPRILLVPPYASVASCELPVAAAVICEAGV